MNRLGFQDRASGGSGLLILALGSPGTQVLQGSVLAAGTGCLPFNGMKSVKNIRYVDLKNLIFSG